MTHDELLTRLLVTDKTNMTMEVIKWQLALRAVVELHKPNSIPDWVPTEEKLICWCAHIYPCPTIQAIEKELG